MAARRPDDPESDVPPPGFGRRGTRLLELAENVVYAGIVVLLLAAGGLLLALAGRSTWQAFVEFDRALVLELLDVLLLIFIVVELLFAVRSTVEKRELVAEPFLLVGIIASIKEIVVLSVEAADEIGRGSQFDDRMTEIAVLGVLVVLLGLTSFLLRRKEREPDERPRGAHRSSGPRPDQVVMAPGEAVRRGRTSGDRHGSARSGRSVRCRPRVV